MSKSNNRRLRARLVEAQAQVQQLCQQLVQLRADHAEALDSLDFLHEQVARAKRETRQAYDQAYESD